MRGEEDEQSEDGALRAGEAELGGQTPGQEGEQNEPEGAVGHLEVGERERDEQHGLQEVVAADAGGDAALAEGLRGVVVELKHFGGSGEVEVVVVALLVLACTNGRCNANEQR